LYIEDEERIVPFDQDEYNKRKSKRFWAGVLRTYGAMLFYGAIATVIFHILRFAISVVLDYSFYKEEIAQYVPLAVCLFAYPLLVGFKHMENCGYIDAYDDCFSFGAGFGRICAATGAMLIIPYMIALRINFLVVYIYSFCYTHTDGVSALISENFFHEYEGTTPLGIVIGTTAVFAVYIFALIPFYYLGRRNCRKDKEMGVKVKIS